MRPSTLLAMGLTSSLYFAIRELTAGSGVTVRVTMRLSTRTELRTMSRDFVSYFIRASVTSRPKDSAEVT